MNIALRNNSRYFFPFYSLNINIDYNWMIFALFFLFILLTIIALISTVQFCKTIQAVNVFHPNMTIIITAIIFQYWEVFIARLLVLPYQVGWVQLKGIDQQIDYWIIFNWEQTPQTDEAFPLIPLFIGGIMILHYGFTLIFSVFILTCERACATYFITNYEKKNRSYIYISLLFSTHFISLTLAVLATFEVISFTLGISISSIFVVSAIIIFFLILHINIQIQKKLNNRNNLSYYSLAVRFQAKENERSLKLARKLVIFATVGVSSAITALTILVLNNISYYDKIIFYSMEILFQINPIFIIPVALSSVTKWRDYFIRTTPLLNKFRISPIHFSAKVNTTKVLMIKESEIYFNQLNDAWK